MFRTTLVLLLLGSAVLAGPANRIRRDGAVVAADTEAAPSTSSTTSTTTTTSTTVTPQSSSSASSTTAKPTPVSTSASQTAAPVTSAGSGTTSTTARPDHENTSAATTPAVTFTTTKPRKVITIDQRQDGKYNIRADLENFVIVVVPSSSSSSVAGAGVSLLDLLDRSNHHKNHHQTRKHPSSSSSSKKRKNHKTTHHGAGKKATAAHPTPEVVVLDNAKPGQLATEEFIEGRTPYKVDLSSSARSATDMLPAVRVMKPFTLNIESGAPGMVRFPAPSGNYHSGTATRQSKSLTGPAANGGELGTNTVSASATNLNAGDGGDFPLYADADDTDRDAANGDVSLLPELSAVTGAAAATEDDAPLLDDDNPPSLIAASSTSFDSLEYPRSDVDMAQLQLQQDSENRGGGWELRLLGAQEQCGPDRRRDSYGVCQFVTP